MLPKGFKVGGVRSGISNKQGKKDLAIFMSDVNATAVGMFTSCVSKAAPVIVDIEKLRTSKNFRAIIANSGCANACTGVKGKNDANTMCEETAKVFGLNASEVLCASTGVIGQYINIPKFKSGLKLLNKSVGVKPANEKDAINAIMTTDTFPKISFKKIKVEKGYITIWGCVKGAGMIHPNMQGLHATMLSFILTDAQIEKNTLKNMLQTAVDQSFHCVSVDGDTSTNDTVIVLANGQSNTGKLSKKDLSKFLTALNEITLDLAKKNSQGR